jgi:hypothetical protein
MYETHMNMHGVGVCVCVCEREKGGVMRVLIVTQDSQLKPILLIFIVYVYLINCVQLKYNYTVRSCQQV